MCIGRLIPIAFAGIFYRSLLLHLHNSTAPFLRSYHQEADSVHVISEVDLCDVIARDTGTNLQVIIEIN